MWQPCAAEGRPIAGPGLVRFGWGMVWVESTLPSGADCSIATFGYDPVPNVQKVCECTSGAAQSMQHRSELGVEWSHCAVEGEDCTCPSGTVRFGTGTRWISSKFDSSRHRVQCSVADFHGLDPAKGASKECWCEDSMNHAHSARVAIVMLSRHPPDLSRWLRYHINYMGVEHIFIQVEGTPEFNSTWNALPSTLQRHITVWLGTEVHQGVDTRPTDDYESLQARQMLAMKRAKLEAADMGIEWLIHIDDDELLFAPLHRPVGEILASMPAGFDQAYIPNVEAVYSSADVQRCFSETTLVNVNPVTFASYANGKAALRVANIDAIPAGPHMWRTSWGNDLSSIHLIKEPFGSPLLVIHFESCPFTRWEDKFWELGNTSPQKVRAIPFRFYKDSILRMQHCRANSMTSPECSEVSLKHLWAKWKTTANPSIRPEDLMPLQIPWADIST